MATASLTIQVCSISAYNARIEFLLASVNKQKAVSQENLQKAFNLFDRVCPGC